MAISVAVAVADAADPLVDALQRQLKQLKSARESTTASRWARSSPVHTATRVSATWTLASEARSRRRRPRPALPDSRTGISSAVPVRWRRAADADLQGRDLRAGAVRRARAGPGNGHPSRQRARIPAMARPSSRPVAKPRGRSPGVQAGMVGINVPIPRADGFHSFGGWKRSLFGALHVHGPDGVRFYTRLRPSRALPTRGGKARNSSCQR